VTQLQLGISWQFLKAAAPNPQKLIGMRHRLILIKTPEAPKSRTWAGTGQWKMACWVLVLDQIVPSLGSCFSFSFSVGLGCTL
jgi:hypothetical protein